MKPIVVVGSINMDLVSRVERIPSPGETVLGTGFQTHSGGKGANQAVAVARLDYSAILLGKVGNDLFGSQLVETLRGYHVNTEEIEVAEGASGTASIAVDARGENSIIVTPAANQQVTPAYLESKRSVLQSAGMVLTQLETPMETVRYLAKMCSQMQVPLMLDPAPARSIDRTTLELTTWFTPNQTEAAFYSGGSATGEAVVEKLFAQGLQRVILKQGAQGVVLANRDGTRLSLEAFPVEAVDTTAAGDAFNGAFAVALTSGGSYAESIRYAAAAAALCVSRAGAQPSMPSQNAVADLLDKYPANQATASPLLLQS